MPTSHLSDKLLPIQSVAVFGSTKGGKSVLLQQIFDKLGGKKSGGLSRNNKFCEHFLELPDLRLKITEQTGRMYTAQALHAAYVNLCIFVVDVTDRECLEKLGRWLSLVSQEHRFTGSVLIVGNKIDLARSVSRDMAQSWCGARARGKEGILKYIETSASEGRGIDELVVEMGRLLRNPVRPAHCVDKLRQALAGPPVPMRPRAWCPAICCPCACPGTDANWYAESEECSCIIMPCMCGNVCEAYLCGVVPCYPSSVSTNCDPCCCCNAGCLPWCAFRIDLEQTLLGRGFTTTSMAHWGLPWAREREPNQPPHARPRCFPFCCCVHPCLRPREGYMDTGRQGLPFYLDFIAYTCACCVRGGPMDDTLECSNGDPWRCAELLCYVPCYVVVVCSCAVCSELCERCSELCEPCRWSAGSHNVQTHFTERGEGGEIRTCTAKLADSDSAVPRTTVMERGTESISYGSVV